MAFDDPIVWVLIIAVVVFLFGANKIPQLAKAIGQAKREFDQASKDINNPSASTPSMVPSTQWQGVFAQPATPAQTTVTPSVTSVQLNDPLILAAQKEGIITEGKTRDQVATELAWKLKQQSSS